MAVLLVTANVQQYVGQSYDAKPTNGQVSAGATFHELDTGRDFQWDGQNWQQRVPLAPASLDGISDRDLRELEYWELRAIRMAWEEWLEKDQGELLEQASQPEED